MNKDNPDQNVLKKSIESRIIVAGSGGGASSGDERPLGKIDGFPGGNISAISNGAYVLGGNQISGKLGIGDDGSSSSNNEGASGGCGSGYRGGINKLPSNSDSGYFQIGGTGGSSYISGHFGCISPNHQNDLVENKQNSIHESGYIFTDTKIINGQEKMPSPYNDSFIIGNIGNGIGRITFLYAYINSCVIFKSNYYLFMFSFTALNPT
ncbi:hypothetical protein TVAG_336040 [Trichomonas vaginalis G3]|uniref:receptor protein-tyrosine kinase n=1 Tax=Trichomonas vaginalis (strain ATCC PRA-98 / G3) TaxID=412133 RepID=A2FN90_TRIV3|nr:glycine-rich protein family [Trichomonas vaginalis G3]EAX93618.1 hypothetical protein TVAG_336040 [Trichomonas vaginalis G3]KAI5496131.1 glycine-rich protein family [Trichomonas vaginalis G3]|eukprot:XP_001306548.1 hypothetical protein [Trichomonas vaginalis G3]